MIASLRWKNGISWKSSSEQILRLALFIILLFPRMQFDCVCRFLSFLSSFELRVNRGEERNFKKEERSISLFVFWRIQSTLVFQMSSSDESVLYRLRNLKDHSVIAVHKDQFKIGRATSKFMLGLPDPTNRIVTRDDNDQRVPCVNSNVRYGSLLGRTSRQHRKWVIHQRPRINKRYWKRKKPRSRTDRFKMIPPLNLFCTKSDEVSIQASLARISGMMQCRFDDDLFVSANDLAIANNRYISTSHCQLQFEHGRIYLRDTSSNGTLLNRTKKIHKNDSVDEFRSISSMFDFRAEHLASRTAIGRYYSSCLSKRWSRSKSVSRWMNTRAAAETVAFRRHFPTGLIGSISATHSTETETKTIW